MMIVYLKRKQWNIYCIGCVFEAARILKRKRARGLGGRAFGWVGLFRLRTGCCLGFRALGIFCTF
jgi:hypothetical protein